ncbi:hypothetical protein PV11_05564 [Exophiala sideris]|uniref:Biotrophy-associated secreted protein 2 n=1 Tax=Exophiala sideris TaxID=1016849 RepID=A0A0D1W4B9_9EURO|nr:hypothetical protein PV11_05564 [Exophiala sideris]
MSKISIPRSLTVLFLLLNFTLLALGNGTQFITGACTSDSDCASGCCGFNTGKCAGAVVAQERDGGCGFGDATPNSSAAVALAGGTPTATSAADAGPAETTEATATATEEASTAINSSLPGAENVGNGAGKQFITAQCQSDADCASGCCGFNTGLCAGAVIAQTRDGGCGFGNTSPNNIAAQALTGGGSAAAPAATAASAINSLSASIAAAPTPTESASTTINSSLAGAANVGNGAGKQFITGQCLSDADCASGCCGFNSGLCAGAIIAQTRDGGCGHGNSTPNDNAAQALTGGAKRRAVREYMA